MFLIAGLGNPGMQYAGTRHNVGFSAITCLSDEYQIPVNKREHRALCGSGRIEGERVILAMPQTFMNLSGESIRELVQFYKIDPEKELIVLYDDISLTPGAIRVRAKGSAGGHNGVKSIITCLNTQTFMRVKIGVGEKPVGWDLADFVLSRFPANEEPLIREALEWTQKAVSCILTKGIEAAMNGYNGKRE